MAARQLLDNGAPASGRKILSHRLKLTKGVLRRRRNSALTGIDDAALASDHLQGGGDNEDDAMRVWIFHGGDGYRAISAFGTADHLPRIGSDWNWADPIMIEHNDPSDVEILQRDGYILIRGSDVGEAPT